jgi:hypothetical protein
MKHISRLPGQKATVLILHKTIYISLVFCVFLMETAFQNSVLLFICSHGSSLHLAVVNKDKSHIP